MRLLCFSRSDLILRGCECISDLILRSRAFLRGVSKDGGRLRALRPSFETLAEPVIGPRFARTRWQAPQDEDGDSFTNSEEATNGSRECAPDNRLRGRLEGCAAIPMCDSRYRPRCL